MLWTCNENTVLNNTIHIYCEHHLRNTTQLWEYDYYFLPIFARWKLVGPDDYGADTFFPSGLDIKSYIVSYIILFLSDYRLTLSVYCLLIVCGCYFFDFYTLKKRNNVLFSHGKYHRYSQKGSCCWDVASPINNTFYNMKLLSIRIDFSRYIVSICNLSLWKLVICQKAWLELIKFKLLAFSIVVIGDVISKR